MAREPTIGPTASDDERRDAALRPRFLREVIGQKGVVQRLSILLNAVRKLKEPLSHILFDGPPGLGKTTFATVLPNELGTTIQMTSGPALTKPSDLLPFLTNASEGSIIFIRRRSTGCRASSRSSFIRRWRTSASTSSSAKGCTPGRFRCR